MCIPGLAASVAVTWSTYSRNESHAARGMKTCFFVGSQFWDLQLK